MTIKAVILDVDGTLIDNAKSIADRHAEIARARGMREPTYAELAAMSGKRWEEIIATLWPGINVNEVKGEFKKLPQMDSRAFPGALDTIRQLKARGLLLGIVTGKWTENAFLHLEQAGYNPGDFAFIHGEDVTLATKPDPRTFDNALMALAEHDIKTSEAIYVGDSHADMLAARGAGLGFIAVLTGFGTREDFRGAKTIASVAELPSILGDSRT